MSDTVNPLPDDPPMKCSPDSLEERKFAFEKKSRIEEIDIERQKITLQAQEVKRGRFLNPSIIALLTGLIAVSGSFWVTKRTIESTERMQRRGSEDANELQQKSGEKDVAIALLSSSNRDLQCKTANAHTGGPQFIEFVYQAVRTSCSSQSKDVSSTDTKPTFTCADVQIAEDIKLLDLAGDWKWWVYTTPWVAEFKIDPCKPFDIDIHSEAEKKSIYQMTCTIGQGTWRSVNLFCKGFNLAQSPASPSRWVGSNVPVYFSSGKMLEIHGVVQEFPDSGGPSSRWDFNFYKQK
jgi:hypothetical protein